MWRILVKNQQIEILERDVIASDQIQFVTLRFVFEGKWKSLHKVVQFTQCDETFNRVLGTDGLCCFLPAELHPGTTKMSVFGYDTDNIKALRATTVPVVLHIRESGFMSDGNIPPTPDLYQQLLSEMKNHHGSDGKSGMSAYEIAVTNGFDGSETEWLESLKGRDGVNGLNGNDGADGADGKDGLSAYDIAVKNGFEGTQEEWMESLKGKDGANGDDGRDGADGADGKDGLSAYDIAVKNGFEGTQEEWLESLKGKDGADGTNGSNGNDGKDGADGADGKDGLSAYDIAVKNGFEGTEAEWLRSLKGKDGVDGEDGQNGTDGKNGTNGTDGKDGLSAFEIALRNGFEGTEAEWLQSLKGKDGRDGVNGTDGTSPDLSEIKEEMCDFQSALDELKYDVQMQRERIEKLEQTNSEVNFSEFQSELDELKYTSQMDRERISKLEDNAVDLADINAELSKHQQLLDALKYDSQTYEERLIALENANIGSGLIVFESGNYVLSEYGETVYTFYNDGYRSLSGFAQRYTNFCSANNGYALNFNYDDFSWGGVVYVMFLKPVYIKNGDKLFITYLSGTTDNAEIFLVRRNGQSGANPDIARYIYEQIADGNAYKIPFKWLYSDDYITQLIDLSQYGTADFYLAVKGVSDNTHPKIKSIKIREG